MDIQKLYSIFLNSKGVSTDTRTLQKGTLFFALSGPNFDGNQYAENAIEKFLKSLPKYKDKLI